VPLSEVEGHGQTLLLKERRDGPLPSEVDEGLRSCTPEETPEDIESFSPHSPEVLPLEVGSQAGVSYDCPEVYQGPADKQKSYQA